MCLSLDIASNFLIIQFTVSRDTQIADIVVEVITFININDKRFGR